MNEVIIPLPNDLIPTLEAERALLVECFQVHALAYLAGSPRLRLKKPHRTLNWIDIDSELVQGIEWELRITPATRQVFRTSLRTGHSYPDNVVAGIERAIEERVRNQLLHNVRYQLGYPDEAAEGIMSRLYENLGGQYATR